MYIISVDTIYFISFWRKFFMQGFPISYGDTDDHKLDIIKYRKIGFKVLGVALFLTSATSPAFAAETTTEVAKNTREISNASMALTCAVCSAAGAACKSASEKIVSTKNPKLIGAFGCVALMSWCAAKASPL
jgi:Zn-dependent alcohol dehydrogenase